MINIHLRRTGAKKDPHYRVVVTDSRNARDGAFIEILGHYHPRFEPAKVVLDVDKTKEWISKGAQPSDTVKSLLRKLETGVIDVETAIAPSRQREAAKHAAKRAAEPKKEEQAAPQESAGAESAAAEEPQAEAATAEEPEAEAAAAEEPQAEAEAAEEPQAEAAAVEAAEPDAGGEAAPDDDAAAEAGSDEDKE